MGYADIPEARCYGEAIRMNCPKCGSEMDYQEDVVDIDDMGTKGLDCYWLCECGHEEKVKQ